MTKAQEQKLLADVAQIQQDLAEVKAGGTNASALTEAALRFRNGLPMTRVQVAVILSMQPAAVSNLAWNGQLARRYAGFAGYDPIDVRAYLAGRRTEIEAEAERLTKQAKELTAQAETLRMATGAEDRDE